MRTAFSIFAPENLCPYGKLADGLIRNGWGASAVDAFSTALIMGNTEVVSQILDFVPEIDFSVSFNDTVVSVFETTIRYLGGLLSGTKSDCVESSSSGNLDAFRLT